MKKFKISEEHAKVLKEYRCYSKFMRNIQDRSCNGAWDAYDPDASLSMELSGAFIWYESPQGEEYWQGLHAKLVEAGL
jgi:hypothetical protein